MNVLMITGDKNFAASERFPLQAAQVERLAVMYFGRGGMFPRIPAGQWDTVTVQDPLLRGMFAHHVAKKIGARLNVQVHMDLRALPWWKRAVARFVLRRADSVRVVSEKIKKQVEALGVRAPITVLPVFVDVEKFKAIAPAAHTHKVILWIGRFEDEKNPLQAIEVFKEVRAAGADASLVMLGTGSLGKLLRTGAAGLPVEFPGWQDPAAFLAAADVVLSTSRHESWGASIIEALAAGVAVVAPDIGIAKEAGAIVVPRGQLAQATIDTLRSGIRGTLLLPVLSREEWARAWRQSL